MLIFNTQAMCEMLICNVSQVSRKVKCQHFFLWVIDFIIKKQKSEIIYSPAGASVAFTLSYFSESVSVILNETLLLFKINIGVLDNKPL